MLRPRKLWIAWFGQAASVVAGIFCLASAAGAQGDPQPTGGVGWSQLFGLIGALVSLIVGLWSKHQDTLIQAATAKAKEAWEIANNLQRQIDKEHKPAGEYAKQLEAAMAPLRRDMDRMAGQFETLQQSLIDALLERPRDRAYRE